MEFMKFKIVHCLNRNSFKFISRCLNNKFVPKHNPPNENDIVKLEKFLEDKPNILVLTGAGISTESGV